MKRPFACIGFGMMASMTAAAYFFGAAVLIAAGCAAAAVVFLLIHFVFKKDALSAAVFFIAASIASAAYIAAVELIALPSAERFGGELTTFSGTITSVPYTVDSTTFFTVKADEIGGEKCSLNISVASGIVPDGGMGDHIEAYSLLRTTVTNRNGFTVRAHSIDKIFLQTYISTFSKGWLTVTHEDSGYSLAAFRECIRRCLLKNLPYNEAQLCTAMITGEKNVLPKSIKNSFGLLGVSHITVVSGLHLSIVSGMLYLLLGKRIKNRIISCSVQALGAVAFAVMTGLGASVVRSLIMVLVLMLGQVFHSKADSINSLGFAAVIICADPFSAGDIGMLWSFSCTLALVVLASRNKSVMLSLLAPSAAIIGSLPFIVLFTERISPYALITNLITVPVTGIVIIFGGLGAAAATVFQPLADELFLICGAAAKYLIFITDKMSSLPYAELRFDRAAVILIVLFAAFIGTAAAMLRKRKAAMIAAATAFSLLMVAIGVSIVRQNGTAYVNAYITSSGMTVVLSYHGTTTVLCSYGQYQTLDDSENIGSVYIIDIPPKGFGYDNTKMLLAEYDIAEVIADSEAQFRKSCGWYEYVGGCTTLVNSGDVISLSDDDSIGIYYVDGFVCELVTVNGASLLICEGEEGVIPEELCSADAAVVQSDAITNTLSPDTCVITEGSAQIIFNKDGTLDIELRR